MSIKETSGHQLKIGDRVRMNIAFIEEGDRDGVEITADGTDYWRYMCQHPDEVYTVVGIDPNYEYCPYELSGAMSGNTWGSDELILLPEPSNRFEVVKNMTQEEMSEALLPMLTELFSNGTPTKEQFEAWLTQKP